MTRRICLFAHHDPRQRIAPHVIHYLQQLHLSGFTSHVALSGMDSLQQADRMELDRVGAIPHFRRNCGLDFGAWQDLIGRGCCHEADTILLANDSVFGPLQPLSPIIERMQALGPDVWGMVESQESSWHLQSWFLCFSAAAFAAPAIGRVMRLPFAEMTKAEIILHGELGLGAAIRADALTWDACWRQPTRRLRRLVPGNAMHLDFVSVVRSRRVPFIKVELLRDNPAAVPWIMHWRTVAATGGAMPERWVDDHLGNHATYMPPRPHQSLRMRLLYAIISKDQPEAFRSLFSRPPRRG